MIVDGRPQTDVDRQDAVGLQVLFELEQALLRVGGIDDIHLLNGGYLFFCLEDLFRFLDHDGPYVLRLYVVGTINVRQLFRIVKPKIQAGLDALLHTALHVLAVLIVVSGSQSFILLRFRLSLIDGLEESFSMCLLFRAEPIHP